MGAKKIREKSRLRIIKNDVTPKPVWEIIAFFSITVVLLASFVMIIWSANSPVHFQEKNHELKTKTSYGHMRKTGNWFTGNLRVSYKQLGIELTEELKNFKSFTIKNNSKNLFFKKTSISNVVFSVFGTRNPWQAFDENELIRGFDLNHPWLYNILSRELSPQINKLSQSAILEVKNGWVTKFRPHTIGQSLDIIGTISKIKNSIFTDKSEVVPLIITTRPTIILSDTNNLGIEELVAQGVSNFSGSSASRINNIRVGASRYDGLILNPGEEFSFNEHLGPISSAAGFKPELVIKSNGTVPELGGGLCQVSTTVFRAALYGGLPITARKNHSYAVSYYAPQGTDATIYPGVVDFRFVNNTKNHLLIDTYLDGNELHFDFYGTPDERKVIVDGPHHYDFGAGGSMKALLTRTVITADSESTDEFFSRYVSKNLFPKIFEYPEEPKINEGESDNAPSPEEQQQKEETGIENGEKPFEE